MTGLENIIKHIEEDAAALAEEKISQAKRRADQILLDARTEGERQVKNIEEMTKAEVNICLSRGESVAALNIRKKILSAKQQMIEDILKKAKVLLINMSDEEYFNVLLKMLLKYAQKMPGDIIFSEADKKRLPKKFDKKIKEALSNIPGASLNISNSERKIDGGFILVYEGIEENCTFDALILENREVLQDKISKLLFEQNTA
ncbi:V-type ATP synthase subunit E [Anaerosacchariphilus polymeriproducens]|uniref:V-type proton ATPase subunit E n=1 Tax=Anaerosacchariphilus polymeriproducens TaxID=1812858 RepID=A0A371AQG9_9FIRM|nr:V-type ATP synthase subunit E family protein [Anaerosacchariphilus polymeriproducens]RDU21819.1 hypothetical protein DWV06_17700 [Anaerosacchariphilus polymeriproducens]